MFGYSFFIFLLYFFIQGSLVSVLGFLIDFLGEPTLAARLTGRAGFKKMGSIYFILLPPC